MTQRSMTRIAVTLALVTAACQGTDFQAGDTLSGHWFSPSAGLEANRDSVVFEMSCERAVFPPIVLDANLAFSVDSRTFSEFGNIIHFPDDRLHIQGSVVDGRILLTMYVTRAAGGGSDPVTMTLSPGRFALPFICVA